MKIKNPFNGTFILAFLFTLTFFSKSLRFNINGIGEFDVLAYPILIFFFILLKLNKGELFFLLIVYGSILIIGVLNKFYINYDLTPFFKQYGPIILIYTASYSYLKRVNHFFIFQIYCNLAFIISIAGLIQFVFFPLNIFFFGEIPDSHVISFGNLKLLRLSSILPEPSHYGLVIIPAFIYEYYNRGLMYFRTLTILLSLLLTFSSTVFVTIPLVFLINNLRIHWKSVLIIPIAVVLLVISYISVPAVNYRIDDLIKFWQSDITELNHANMTTISVRSNFDAMIHSLEKNFLLGVGLGGHAESYDEFFQFKELRGNQINSQSAHSLWIRILSETGSLGFILFMSYLIKFYVNDKNDPYHIISLSCLSYFIARIFKLGGYFDYGIYFFAVLYLLIGLTQRGKIKFY